MNFIIKQGDTRNALKATLVPSSDLIDVQSVRFRMATTLFKNVIDRTVDVFDNPVAIVVFLPDEVAIAGNYLAEFVVQYKDGKTEIFPSDDYIKVRILRSVG
jgi:hypothetical protein